VDYADHCPKEFDGPIPITMPRAVSQARNPYAENNDVLLMVARENQSVKAYLGILPGIVNGSPEKRVSWLSCWWKNPEADRSIAGRLFEMYLENSGDRAGLSHWPGSLLKITEKYNIPIHTRGGVLYRFRWGLHPRSISGRITKKAGSLTKIARDFNILSRADSVLNFVYPYPQIHDTAISKSFNIFSEIPEKGFFDFIRKFPGHLTLPNKEMIEWIHNNKWLVSPDEADYSVLNRYYFSYIASDFHFFYPVLTFKSKIVAAGMFSSVNGVVKSIYLYFAEEHKADFFKNLLIYLQNNKRYHSLLTYHPDLTRFVISSQEQLRGIKELKRYYGISGDDYARFAASDGDGDTCFT